MQVLRSDMSLSLSCCHCMFHDIQSNLADTAVHMLHFYNNLFACTTLSGTVSIGFLLLQKVMSIQGSTL